MQRYRLRLEYDGCGFCGWQRQAEGASVQGTLEAALASFTPEAPSVTGAGRTDAGVHASGQVAHLDLERFWLPERLLAALNAHLRPRRVAVRDVGLAPTGFHARFSALRRSYVFRIMNRRAPPALERGLVWHVPAPLDAERMHVAAQALIGRHDFTSFRSSECQALSAVKTLDLLHVRRRGELIEVRATARSFLHHQVRNIVGTLKLVGEMKMAIDFPLAAMAARDRAAAGPTAPPHGLVLERVDYPDGWPRL
jgi:tRNA pseudouridine38-40 synthase